LSFASIYSNNFGSAKHFKKPPVKVAITGASGNIGYALAFRIASG